MTMIQQPRHQQAISKSPRACHHHLLVSSSWTVTVVQHIETFIWDSSPLHTDTHNNNSKASCTMKFATSIATLALLAGSSSAFAPSPRSDVLSSTSLAAQTSRSDFLTQSAAAAFGLLVTAQPANAAKYGSFGAGATQVVNPTDADVDSSVLSSDAVQKSIQRIKGYRNVVQQMSQALQSDPQTNIRPYIIKELDFAVIRDSLNSLGTAYDEDSQRGTDRLVRVILQDITELEVANNVKDGAQRSPRRLEIMQGKLDKLEKAFDEYLAFAK